MPHAAWVGAAWPVKSGANNKYGKNQCQGKETGIYRGKHREKSEEKREETEGEP
jgi:hypothetical protein